MTLYLFTKDQPNVTNCYDQCAVNWPPLLVEAGAQPAAGAGVPGQLGVIDRTDGTRQVTYNSMPLYYYVKDTQAGDVTGQNVGEVWFVVHPDISSMTVDSPMVFATQYPDLGTILTSDGMTLYLFTKDQENVTNCYDQCAVNWPPLLTNGGQPAAGKGVTGQLGVIDRTDGTQQVTYNGIPLYYYIKDVKFWDVTGQGVGDVWFVVHPEDTAATAAAMTAAPAATPAPATLPATGGQLIPWASLALVTVGALLLAGGLAWARAHRTR
jgi:predicted lipoprotein with Yx(FWY)xxD motif